MASLHPSLEKQEDTHDCPPTALVAAPSEAAPLSLQPPLPEPPLQRSPASPQPLFPAHGQSEIEQDELLQDGPSLPMHGENSLPVWPEAEAICPSSGEGNVDELGKDGAHSALANQYLSAAELVAKARAPVKREFLRTAAVRVIAANGTQSSGKGDQVGGRTEAEGVETIGGTKILVEKKSRRQQKRERQQAKKSVENVCAAVAITGDVSACPYGSGCRFNHDLTAFLAQKPPDLSGKCPFLIAGKPCTFGVACRFASSHDDNGCKDEGSLKNMHSYEMNTLSKDFQRKLWKNSVSFPKADAQLQALGISGKSKQKTPKNLPAEKLQTKSEQNEAISSVQKPLRGETVSVDKDGLVREEDGNKSMAGAEEINRNALFEAEMLQEQSMQEEHSPVLKRARTEVVQEVQDNESGSAVAVEHSLNGAVVDAMSAKEAYYGETESLLCGSDKEFRLTRREKKLIDFRGKLYLAPLTTVGNLPFRRVCKQLGADITCGEMAMCTNLLQGQASEWALLRRHSVEDIFGVQICGAHPDTVARTVEMIEQECNVSFIDINVGCPIDLVVNKGAGSCLLTKPGRLEHIVKAASASLDNPLTFKVRTGYFEGKNCVHSFVPNVSKWGASAITIHGRTRQQRYSKLADWDYIYQCASLAPDNFHVIGNGDIFAYTDWNEHLKTTKLSTCMVARGALIKPWLFTEIKEQRHWDITAEERLDILRDYARFGLEHWGSDLKGVETTRHFLLEWLSYLHRYIPVGLLEIIPQKLNWRPPNYFGRNELETLMASDSAVDWVRISEMLLGPAPANFTFTPRHKSNAYDKAENG